MVVFVPLFVDKSEEFKESIIEEILSGSDESVEFASCCVLLIGTSWVLT